MLSGLMVTLGNGSFIGARIEKLTGPDVGIGENGPLWLSFILNV